MPGTGRPRRLRSITRNSAHGPRWSPIAASALARARSADQKRKAVRNFKHRGPRRVKRILARVGDDRLGSFHDLAGFSDGCGHLAEIFARMIEVVSSRGYLLPGEIDAAALGARHRAGA